MNGMYRAMLKAGRLVSADVMLAAGRDALPAGMTYYQRGGLTLQRDTPILVDHDETRPIGRVKELFEFEDTDGTWLAALAEITDPPDWLGKGTRVSMCFASAGRQRLGAAERILRGVIPEISVLSPSRQPVDPLAQVVTYHLAEPQQPRTVPVERAAERLAGRSHEEQARVNALVAEGWPREHLEKLAAESDPLRWRVTHPRDIGALLEVR